MANDSDKPQTPTAPESTPPPAPESKAPPAGKPAGQPNRPFEKRKPRGFRSQLMQKSQPLGPERGG